MDDEVDFAQLLGLVGEPARARMLWRLLDGQALTATELADHADVSPQSASAHLNKLMAAGLLVVERQGRHRYYRFARSEVAYAIEALANLLPHPPTRHVPDRTPVGLRYVRTCYDHLAGRVAVEIYQALVHRHYLVPDGSDLTPTGHTWCQSIGIMPIDFSQAGRRALVRPCLDWSERRPHLAGKLGSLLLDQFVSLDWMRKTTQARGIVITLDGQSALYHHLGLRVSV